MVMGSNCKILHQLPPTATLPDFPMKPGPHRSQTYLESENISIVNWGRKTSNQTSEIWVLLQPVSSPGKQMRNVLVRVLFTKPMDL